MTKAEEKAMEAYPERWQRYPRDGIVRSHEYFDENAARRAAYQRGYEEAMEESAVLQQRAFERGKEHGLMICPKWKTADRDLFTDSIDFAIKYKHDGGDYADWESIEVTNRVMKGERYLELSDLEVLLSLDNKGEPQ